MKTYSRADWEASLVAWDEGSFSPEWKAIRHVMAMQGCIFPPAGDMFDSWDDDQPSQRAVLIRAMRETPELLRRCTRKATTWNEVIERLFKARDDWRENLDRLDSDREFTEAFDRPTHRQAAMALSEIIKRIGDSA